MKTTAEGEKLLAAIAAHAKIIKLCRFRTATGLYTVRLENLAWFAEQVRKKFIKARRQPKRGRHDPSLAELIGPIERAFNDEVAAVTYDEDLLTDMKATLLTLLRTGPMGCREAKQKHADKIREIAEWIEAIQRKGVMDGSRAYTDLDLYYQPELAENL